MLWYFEFGNGQKIQKLVKYIFNMNSQILKGLKIGLKKRYYSYLT